ncbi:bifunctional folylpolyglutamate synthase/dihydrofolate synthase [Clostridium sp. B9]|uniref:bifunctional folylpolyglutamate synthase/dihydrofolate synthase n=1 Tax=Clostridium sp. B9 TaxID=3423224 RepID=UPI003D2F2C1C
MNYDEAMEYIVTASRFGMNFGLDRIEKVLEFLGDPHRDTKFIHIGGTNGKGSTTAMITSVLREAGYKVGMYTSPYLEEFEERIQINGENIKKEDLALLMNDVKNAIEKVVELGYESPTQFEIITALMFYYFSKKKVDYAVLEVGLGGRLDATNVISPELVILTSISLDHMNILGGTIAEIAGEKCGIIKDGVPVISYPQDEEALEVIRNKTQELGCDLEVVDLENLKDITIDKKKHVQKIKALVKEKAFEIDLPLLGEHQVKNCLVALSALQTLHDVGVNISEESIKSGIGKVKWIGRMEILKENPLVVIDGAHNIDGIKSLRRSVDKYFDFEEITLILGILGDKQVDEMIYEITNGVENVVVVEPHSDRAENIDELKEKVEALGKTTFKFNEYRDAYKKGLELVGDKDLLLICGSLYMVGDMRKAIRDKSEHEQLRTIKY